MPAPIETVVVDGRALSRRLRQELADEVSRLVAAGERPPCLAVVVVGDDPASLAYIKGKQRAGRRAGVDSVEHHLAEDTPEIELLDLIAKLNAAQEVDGILVQLPLPPQIRAQLIAEAVDPAKDVDGLHPMNAGRLLQGEPCHVPCTPRGILTILDEHGISLEGAHAVVIGRSQIVGKPVSILLQQRHATVTMCHSRTRDLAEVCRSADVLVAAVGRPRLVRADWIRPGAAVIDVGVTEVDGTLVGDVDFEGAQSIAGLITPHRRGVGPMTITCLLQNTLEARRLRTSA